MLVGILIAYWKFLSRPKREVAWTCQRCGVTVYTAGPMPPGWLPLNYQPRPCLCGNCAGWARSMLRAKAA